MDENLGKFIADFGTLARLAQAGLELVKGGDELLRTLTDHLGAAAQDLSVVVEEIAPHRLVDLDILLEAMAGGDPDNRLVGIGGGEQRNHMSLGDIIQQSLIFPNFPLSQPDYTNLAVGPDEQRQAVALGLRLFTYASSPVAVLQREAKPKFGRQFAALEVLAARPSVAADFLANVRREMEHRSVFKGQIIALSISDFGPSVGGVTFVRRPELSDSDVILPDGLLSRVENHTLGIARQADVLRAHGQHLKRGLLLYGPPGTGKTHTVRYLLSQSEGTTAVLLSGGSLARISEAAKTARALAPSIVVLEDCDLIAEDRSFGHGPQPLLFEVLDAMDGLDNDSDVAFVLTTNRVDMLERALAQRPGRVDLAVEIPLPSEHERTELLRLYSRGLAFSPSALESATARTAGTTASFAKELVRRSVVAASLAAEDPADAHLAAAVDQLMADGEALTRSLLGTNADPGERGPGGQPGFPGPYPAPYGSMMRYGASYRPVEGA
ncbi:ATP-binding protein [Paenarthrobacter sp. PH39-S1]|uniref:AAA family ATPase n=1 Tax=Paenarthrobacter sp. PH39-S1 TaxID=3046204 RepID=UPI0024B8A3B8|nr:ATP-binding protein [Paenarthrobacter sp. PH39-S1]MDJ0356245.1 ATP-binding protein [Paenarthrobacter sp. PH39-S1]